MTPPGYLDYYTQAVEALADGHIPNFEDADPEEVFQAFNRWLWGFTLDGPRALMSLDEDVTRASNGRFQLRLVDSDEFRFRIKGFAIYAELQNTSTGRYLRLAISQGVPPFLADSEWQEARPALASEDQ